MQMSLHVSLYICFVATKCIQMVSAGVYFRIIVIYADGQECRYNLNCAVFVGIVNLRESCYSLLLSSTPVLVVAKQTKREKKILRSARCILLSNNTTQCAVHPLKQ